MAIANHNDTIVINIFLDAAPITAVGFGTVMLLVDEATGNSLNGDRVKTYATLAAAQADNTAGFISTLTLSFITAAFLQRPQPTLFKVGRIDTGGAETYSTGLAAVRVADDDWYGICIDRRTDADILLVSADIESLNRLFMFQSADSDWLTAGVPAALSTLATRENTNGIYMDTSTVISDASYVVDRLAFNQDAQSTTWNAAPNGSFPYAVQPTQAEIIFARANFINIGAQYSTSASGAYYIDPGVSMTGRPIYEKVTADWFRERLLALVQAQKLKYTLRGEKIILDETGSTLIQGLIDQQFAAGVTAGHFVRGQTNSQMETITPADRAARRIRGGGRAQLAGDAREFEFNFFFGRDPINEA